SNGEVEEVPEEEEEFEWAEDEFVEGYPLEDCVQLNGSNVTCDADMLYERGDNNITVALKFDGLEPDAVYSMWGLSYPAGCTNIQGTKCDLVNAVECLTENICPAGIQLWNAAGGVPTVDGTSNLFDVAGSNGFMIITTVVGENALPPLVPETDAMHLQRD
ncbi:unnamed protein product, partial [Chrysoparadoxa australica]